LDAYNKIIDNKNDNIFLIYDNNNIINNIKSTFKRFLKNNKWRLIIYDCKFSSLLFDFILFKDSNSIKKREGNRNLKFEYYEFKSHYNSKAK